MIDHHPFSYALPYQEVNQLDCEITVDEVMKAIQNCKDNKAPGEDRVPAEFFKNAPIEFIHRLTGVFNKIFNSANVPEEFRKSIIFPLFKKGDPGDPGNYRGIAFINVVAKIFAAVFRERIEKWVHTNNLLSEFQAGFRKQYSTVDNIFLLTNIAKLYISKNKKLYVFFVDFKAAFDSIIRSALFYKLSNLGLSTKVLRIIRSLYYANKSAVWDGANLSDWFATEAGVKQGCVLSPLLFALFIDDLTSFLPGGISINGTLIKTLLYADDLVIIAETPRMLQLMINKLHELWGLVVNTEKSKIMIFKEHLRQLKREEKWYLNDQPLEVVNEYKYLGVRMAYNTSFHPHLKQKLSDAKLALNCSWRSVLGNKNVKLSAKYKVFQAAVESILCYAAQVWGLEKVDEVENLLRYFIKRIFSLPSNTPNYMIYLETGLSPLYLDTLKMHFNYTLKVANLPDSRLAKQMLIYLAANKNLLFKEWLNMAEEYQEPLDLQNTEGWKLSQHRIIVKIDASERDKFIYAAQTSFTRQTYKQLCYNLNEKNYFNEEYKIEAIRVIFKARGELLMLNFRPYISGANSNCTLCNMQLTEDVRHFIGVCPILKELRIAHLGKSTMEDNEVYDWLNGKNWQALANYIMASLTYRTRIIEGNF